MQSVDSISVQSYTYKRDKASSKQRPSSQLWGLFVFQTMAEGISDGYFSLQQDVNKVKPEVSELAEGPIAPLLPELELSMSDEELINLKKSWEKQWQPVEAELKKKQELNEKYWLGKHFTQVEELSQDKPIADNLIFESLETFLPIATRQNPEPIVECDNTDEGQKLADRLKKMLSFLADNMSLKLKLKKLTRYWALYHLGVVKIGWSTIKDDIDIVILRPQKLILDPTATIEDGEYTGKYIGEHRKDTAENLVLRYPKQKSFIEDEVKGEMASEIGYIEWWTDDYVFWTVKDEVLDKKRNPHWNYDTEKKTVDQFGAESQSSVRGNNHFPIPKKPYVFLSVFNLGKRPFDDTGLIAQNLKLQDMVNKRLKQIDKNADNTNGGLIVSGDYYTKEQAGLAVEALRKGSAIWQPSGDVNRGSRRDVGPPLPTFVYQSLIDYRTELRNIFGTSGSTPGGTKQEQTVRGKIIVKGQDMDRIGGGISEYLEQVADNLFNWFVQLMYVYYDEPHSAAVLGKERAQEYITIKNSDLNRKILVSVKEGSMIPKDSLTKRNEAIDLWSAGALDPITLFDRLEFPNPRETAKNLFIWKTQPQLLFPDLMQPQQMMPGQQGQPGQATMQPEIPQGEQVPPENVLSQVPIQ